MTFLYLGTEYEDQISRDAVRQNPRVWSLELSSSTSLTPLSTSSSPGALRRRTPSAEPGEKSICFCISNMLSSLDHFKQLSIYVSAINDETIFPGACVKRFTLSGSASMLATSFPPAPIFISCSENQITLKSFLLNGVVTDVLIWQEIHRAVENWSGRLYPSRQDPVWGIDCLQHDRSVK